jgi:signal transduction histidine kinase
VRSPEEYAQVLTDLGQDVERLIHLSSALLILARLDQNQQEWQMEMLDVSELLETMVDSMQPLASTREITFTSTVPTGLFVSGDFDELTRLFLNLLDNALKYTPARGRVTVLGKQTGEDIVLAIRDSGPGIAPEHLPHLFERFYRVEEGRTRSSGGAGLGLAIAHEIARKHGGSLEVESKLKQGTTVTVHLPFHSAK